MTSEDEARPAPEPTPEPIPATPEPVAPPPWTPDPPPAPEPVSDSQLPPLQGPASPPLYQPYWVPPKPGTNGFAVAALVVGIVGLCLCFGFLGIIFGNVARRQIEETGQAGAGMATAGIVLGWIAVAWIALRIVLFIGVGAFETGM
jgi:hypothetical protein